MIDCHKHKMCYLVYHRPFLYIQTNSKLIKVMEKKILGKENEKLINVSGF
jgi:hypothetical protein